MFDPNMNLFPACLAGKQKKTKTFTVRLFAGRKVARFISALQCQISCRPKLKSAQHVSELFSDRNIKKLFNFADQTKQTTFQRNL